MEQVELERLCGLVAGGVKRGEVIVIGSGSIRGSGKSVMMKMMIEQAIREHPGNLCCEESGHEVGETPGVLIIDGCDNSEEAITARREQFKEWMNQEVATEPVKSVGWDEPGGKRKAQWKRETGFGSGRFYQRQVRK